MLHRSRDYFKLNSTWQNEDTRRRKRAGVSGGAGGQIRYQGGPLRRVFVGPQIGAIRAQRTQKGMTVKYDARYAPACTALSSARGPYPFPTRSRRRTRRWGQGGRMCESRMAPLMISEHLDRLKKDFHYRATTTALSDSVLSARY